MVFERPSLRRSKLLTKVAKKQYRNPIHLAREWRKALDKGDFASQADLARKLGVSRARVTQILRLLRLDPEVIQIVAALGDPLHSRIVTERALRPLVLLPREEQRQKVKIILGKSC